MTAGRTSNARHDGAEPTGGRDGLQPGDSCPDHERPDGRDRAGGGHQHGEELGNAVGGEQHRFVSGDRGLRRKRIHRLSPGDPRNRLHGEGDDSLLAEARNAVRVGQRLQETDEDRAGRHLRGFLGRWSRDARDGVGPDEEPVGVNQLSACGLVLRVRKSGGLSSSTLDSDLEAAARELRDGFGDERHATLARSRLFRDRDSHGGRELYSGALEEGSVARTQVSSA